MPITDEPLATLIARLRGYRWPTETEMQRAADIIEAAAEYVARVRKGNGLAEDPDSARSDRIIEARYETSAWSRLVTAVEGGA